MLLCGRLCLAGGFPYVRRRARPDLDPERQRDPGHEADGDAVHPGGGGSGVGGAVGAEHAGSRPLRCACRPSGAPPCMRPGSNGRGRSRPPASIGRPPPLPPPHPPTGCLSCGAARSSRRVTATATRPSPRRGSAGRDRCTSSRLRSRASRAPAPPPRRCTGESTSAPSRFACLCLTAWPPACERVTREDSSNATAGEQLPGMPPPEKRPTAAQLLQHPWLDVGPLRQQPKTLPASAQSSGDGVSEKQKKENEEREAMAAELGNN